jgi:hypothetical protein
MNVIDAAARFDAIRHARWYEAFCAGQMSEKRLILRMEQDAGFRSYVAQRLQDVRDRQRDAHADDMG